MPNDLSKEHVVSAPADDIASSGGGVPALEAEGPAGRTRSIALDVNTFIGGYPFRHIPHPDPDVLTRVLAREGIRRAWVGHLPSAFHRDPTHGNAELLARLQPYRSVLDPTPIVRPDWPAWQQTLREFVAQGVRAIRVYPRSEERRVGKECA